MGLWRVLTIILVIGFILAGCNFQPAKETVDEVDAQFTGWNLVGSTYLNINSAISSSLALDAYGNPVVSWSECSLSTSCLNYNIYVKRWNGSNWIQLGGSLDFNGNQPASQPSLALDSSGNPVVSWHESNGTTTNIYVKRWNGSIWVNVGSGILNGSSASGSNALNPDLALDSFGNPVVAWEEYDGTAWKIYVSRWDGINWILQGSFPNTGDNFNPKLALDNSGRSVVSWQQGGDIKVVRWNGSTWTPLGSSSQGQYTSLALDSSGNPVVSWQGSDGTSSNIYVKRWDSNISNWVQLGGILDVNPSSSAFLPSLKLDSAGNPVVGWHEYVVGTVASVFVKRWNSGTSTWTPLGGALDFNSSKHAYNSSLALDSSGNPAVSWNESNGTSNIYVKRYTKNTFKLYGEALDTNALNNATDPSITMDNRPRPVVAWAEDIGNTGSTDIYVKRWLGTTWSATLPIPDLVASNNTYEPSIKVEKSTVLGAFKPVVAFSEEFVAGTRNIVVRRWNGTSWANYGSGNLNINSANNAIQPSLALSSSNKPYVAWVENNDIVVKGWTGSVWQQLGGFLDKTLANDAQNPSIAIDGLGRVLVAWEEYDFPNSVNIHLKRWDGTSWTFLGTTLDKNLANDAFSPSLVIDSNNQPVVAWHESVSGSYNVYAKRWDGTSWLNLGGAIDRTSGSNATYPSLAMGTDNNPVITWDDGGNIYVKRWDPVTLRWLLVSSQAVDGTLSQIATFPSVTLDATNKPIVAFQESITVSNNNILVKGF